jgi:NifU-like protein involved in Fe-S cluster formation
VCKLLLFRGLYLVDRLKQYELQTLYSKTFKDHIANPRNAGELPDANATAEETNPVCGDRLRLMLRIREQRVEAATFLAYGCPPTLVCGSMLTELLTGKTVDEAMLLTRTDLVAALGGLPSRKHHAAALAIEALHSAIDDKSSGGKPL